MRNEDRPASGAYAALKERKKTRELDRLKSNINKLKTILEPSNRRATMGTFTGESYTVNNLQSTPGQGRSAIKVNKTNVKTNVSKTTSDILVPIGTRIHVTRMYEGLLEGEYMVTQLALDEYCTYALVDLDTSNCWHVLSQSEARCMSMSYVNLTVLLGFDKGIKCIGLETREDRNNLYMLKKGRKAFGTLTVIKKRLF